MCVQSDVQGTPDGTVALFPTTSESVSSTELDKLATSLTTNDTGMVTGGLLDPQSPSAAPLTVTADITTSTQSPSGEAAFTTSSSPSFYASSTASAAASIIYEETTSDVTSSTAAASQQPMTIIQVHGMYMVFLFLGSVALAVLITASVLISVLGPGGSPLHAKNNNMVLQGNNSNLSSHHSRCRATESKDAADKNAMQGKRRGWPLDMLFSYACPVHAVPALRSSSISLRKNNKILVSLFLLKSRHFQSQAAQKVFVLPITTSPPFFPGQYCIPKHNHVKPHITFHHLVQGGFLPWILVRFTTTLQKLQQTNGGSSEDNTRSWHIKVEMSSPLGEFFLVAVILQKGTEQAGLVNLRGP